MNESIVAREKQDSEMRHHYCTFQMRKTLKDLRFRRYLARRLVEATGHWCKRQSLSGVRSWLIQNRENKALEKMLYQHAHNSVLRLRPSKDREPEEEHVHVHVPEEEHVHVHVPEEEPQSLILIDEEVAMKEWDKASRERDEVRRSLPREARILYRIEVFIKINPDDSNTNRHPQLKP